MKRASPPVLLLAKTVVPPLFVVMVAVPAVLPSEKIRMLLLVMVALPALLSA